MEAAAVAAAATIAADAVSASHHSHSQDEGTGRTILYSMLLVVGLCQAGVFLWKKYHVSSFNFASLVAMWIFPVAWTLVQGETALHQSPFFYAWLLFSVLMATLVGAVHTRTLAEATPGVVYGVLEQVYLNCMFVVSSVLTGVFALVLVPPLANLVPAWALTLFFGCGAYAVYFAVLSRDITGVISDTLVRRLGFASAKASQGGGDKDGSGSSTSTSVSSKGGSGEDRPPASHHHSLGNKCALCGGTLDIVDEGSVVEEGMDGGDPTSLNYGRPYALRRADGSIVIISGGQVFAPGMIPLGAGGPGYPAGRSPAAPSATSPASSSSSSTRGGSSSSDSAPKTLRFASRDGKTIMFQLTCKHIFHRTCLAGWCVVGKKGVCPCCSERVDMQVVYSHSPLIGKTSAAFAQILEVARYLVV